jgi:hypothetical protein
MKTPIGTAAALGAPAEVEESDGPMVRQACTLRSDDDDFGQH